MLSYLKTQDFRQTNNDYQEEEVVIWLDHLKLLMQSRQVNYCPRVAY